jgi:hypothetical protein
MARKTGLTIFTFGPDLIRFLLHKQRYVTLSRFGFAAGSLAAPGMTIVMGAGGCGALPEPGVDRYG